MNSNNELITKPVERATFSVKEIAEYLGVSKELIYRLVREGKIPRNQIGKRILFRKATIDDWLDKSEINK